MMSCFQPGTTARMGSSLVAHPSDRKAAMLVGDGAFGWWACLDTMTRVGSFCPTPPQKYFIFVLLCQSGFDVCWYGVFWIWIVLEGNRRKIVLIFSKKLCLRKEKQVGEEMLESGFLARRHFWIFFTGLDVGETGHCSTAGSVLWFPLASCL